VELDDRILEAFRLLSNPVNVELLLLLSTRGFNPRELSKLLGRDETDISRRLRRLEKAGLVVGEWTRKAGRNVKVYRLRLRRLCLRLGEDGIELSPSWDVEPKALARRIKGLATPPRPPPGFAGRARELRLLEDAQSGLLVVTGLPGIGKTSLLAKYVAQAARPAAWYSFTGLEDVKSFYWALSLRLSEIGGETPFYSFYGQQLPVQAAAKTLAEAMDSVNLVLVLDDFHMLQDTAVLLLVSKMAALVERAQILVASRRKPSSLLASVPGSRLIELGGLRLQEVRSVLELLGLKLSPAEISRLYSATQGHPLLVRIFAEIAARKGVEAGLRAVESQRLEDLWRSVLESLTPCEAEALSVLAALPAPLPPELLEKLTRCRHIGTAIYHLLDAGLIEDGGEGYTVKDIVRRLRPRRGVAVPRRLTVEAGDWFLSRGTPRSVLHAIRLYDAAGDERRIVKAIRYRMAHIGVEMAPLAGVYVKELTRVLEGSKSPYTRAYILLELAADDTERGRFRDAYEKARSAYEVFRSRHDAAAMLAAIARLLWLYPSPIGREEAGRLVEEGEKTAAYIRAVDAFGRAALLLFYSNLARYYASLGETVQALEVVRRELALAEAIGNRFEELHARLHLAVALALNCRHEEALREAEAALSGLYPEAPEPLLATALWVLSGIYLQLGRWREAYRSSKEAYEIFDKYENVYRAAGALAIQAVSLLHLGLHGAARGAAEKLVDLVEEKIGTWRGLEPEGLAALAVLLSQGATPKRLVEELREAFSDKGRPSSCEMKPYIDAAVKYGGEKAGAVLGYISRSMLK